ncbi:hypothetical protein, partial [Streptomyces sp. NPDC002676]
FVAYGWSGERSLPAVHDQVDGAVAAAVSTGWKGVPLEKSSSRVAAVTVRRLGACPDDRVPVVQGDPEVALPAVVAAPRG